MQKIIFSTSTSIFYDILKQINLLTDFNMIIVYPTDSSPPLRRPYPHLLPLHPKDAYDSILEHFLFQSINILLPLQNYDPGKNTLQLQSP